MESIRFYDANAYEVPALVNELKNHSAIITEELTGESVTFYDTFDWRLFNASLLLLHSGCDLSLRRMPTGELLQRQLIETRPTFAWDIPEGALKKTLDPILEIRALIKLVDVEVNTTPVRILNDDQKTVARLTYQTLEPALRPADRPLKQLCLEPVKGYGKDGRRLAAFLEQIGLAPVQASLFQKALAYGDREPGDYSTKLNFKLEPDLRADEATRVILRHLLQTIRANEAGIKADIDTEFLHDFRVAVRRTRSALSQIKGVFPEAPTVRFRRDFAYIGKFTNDLRDLDVYLLAEDSYKARLPDHLGSGLDPLMAHLQQKRSAALESVINELNSQKYAVVLHDWALFLNEPGSECETAPNGAIPIIDLARRRIYKRYKRIVKWGQQILKNMEDDQLHALRIECKKLRYLLEFFQSLFPAQEVSVSIKQLKLLQTNLGDFNDLCVQEEYLGHVVEELPLAGSEDKHLFLAIGYLINTLHQERERVKAEFTETFAGFTTPANKGLFKKLFAAKNK